MTPNQDSGDKGSNQGSDKASTPSHRSDKINQDSPEATRSPDPADVARERDVPQPRDPQGNHTHHKKPDVSG